MTMLQVAAQQAQTAPAVASRIGQPNAVAMVFFFLFISITLGITYWAARRTRTTEEFYAAGRSITPGQNGFALAGDYMSAASFLGIAGLEMKDGAIALWLPLGYTAGYLALLLFVAAPLRRLGAYTISDFAEARLGSPALRR